MLRFDRYVAAGTRALDIASGRLVELRGGAHADARLSLFESREGRTLIDYEAAADGRVEVWEYGAVHGRARAAAAIVRDFVEAIECARLGAPRAIDLPSLGGRQREYVRVVLAREARVRGWIPADLNVLAALSRTSRFRPPRWMAERSLVVFAEVPVAKEAMLTLWHIARRDARPHVIVRSALGRGKAFTPLSDSEIVVHEEAASLPSAPAPGAASAEAEAAARWPILIEALTTGRESPAQAAQLAEVLLARGLAFEARAIAAPLAAGTDATAARAAAVVAAVDARNLSCTARGWEMVDDFVGVLQMCQDVEDEQQTLARVSAFLRERLQASSVAFIARDGGGPRVLTRAGSTAAGVDLALRAIESGVALAPPRQSGPVESACPVRHAAEVIGALWCRWSAGMPVAPQQAATLLGVAAAAAAPSLRLALARLAPIAAGENPVPELVGDGAAMRAVRAAIVRAAQSPFPVIVEGESGSGKELAARAIHSRSARRDRRFCAINCAALVDDLVEAELFGHARGAFTGAHVERPGLFEEASGGTLFMDEIAELSARVQAKLLRVLQEGEVRRVGESFVRRIDVRLVAATNRPLAREVAAGRFRADLWYRLDVIRVALPPLRERVDDLPQLARHVWQALATRVGTRAVLAPSTVAALAAYPWPGNVRELQNVLASMLVSAPRAGLIGPASLPAHVARAAAAERDATLAVARRQFDERYVRAALARAGGRTVEAARDLGLSRQGLSKLMDRLGIESSGGDRPGAT